MQPWPAGVQLRGSAIALTPNEANLVAVNRDVGTVTVMSVAVTGGEPTLTKVAEVSVGTTDSEPWQVAIDGCGFNAYVVLRKSQQVVQIININTATPTVGGIANVGSEPTSIAITPANSALYVSNWVDGSITVINPASMTVTQTIDLNKPLANLSLNGNPVLGTEVASAPRPGLAHPRGIAITNNGTGGDSAQTVYATEWFAVRSKPEGLGGSTTAAAQSDINWDGVLYSIPVSTGTPALITLPPVLNTGFEDSKGFVTGCFPNQVASVTLDNNGFAWVTSTCASPVGPTGVFQKGQCSIDAECVASNGSGALAAAGSCVNGACTKVCDGSTGSAGTGDGVCGATAAPGACSATNGACAADVVNAKTTTHPAVSIVNLAMGTAVTTVPLDQNFTTAGDITGGVASTRMPLLPVDIGFKGNFAYVVSEGSDAMFRLTTTATGTISTVGSTTDTFLDTRTATDQSIHLPIGVAISSNNALAFVMNDGARNVEAFDLNMQAAAPAAGTLASTAAPTGAALSVQHGKEAFVTGLGRWSLNGAAWNSCAACHFDGLSDNVTWYFARGPRQSVSLDGTFSKSSAAQRALNWGGIFDEVADFESNVRGISGGIGAIVKSVGGNTTAPFSCTVATEATDCPTSVCNATTLTCTPVATDRVNLFTVVTGTQQQGLEGSSTDIANPASTTAGHSVLPSVNWPDIQNYIAQIRSPRAVSANAPNAFTAAHISAGATVFGAGVGNCVGCHSGPQWTISSVFYTPSGDTNDDFPGGSATSLSEISWDSALNSFPAGLFPSFATAATTTPPGLTFLAVGKQDMRSGAPPTFEQLQCVLRPVGTITAPTTLGNAPTGVSVAAVGVLELRQDMVTGAQGAGNANAANNDFTQGFNVPSLLGLQVGGPYFHAGNARTLEELLSSTFAGHYTTPISQVFTPTATQVTELVAFLLSIDESTATTAIPTLGAAGGVICHNP